jgi:hypothetical protein
MRERGIRYDDIKEAIQDGEIIEIYPDDYPFPSCLLLGNGLHVVCSLGDDILYIITAYWPSLDKWENDGRMRRNTGNGEDT